MKINKKFTCDFTQIPNHIINRPDISTAAKGLYLYMVSKPDVWDFSLTGIGSQLKESRPTILKLLDELIKFGFLKKIKMRKNGRQAISEFDIFSEPEPQNQNTESKLLTQYPRVKNTDSVIFTTSNKNTSNKNKAIKNNSLKAERDILKNLQSFKAHFLNKNTNVPFNTTGLGYLPTTQFVANSAGYLVNCVSDTILSKDEAFKIWLFLFDFYKSQSKIGASA